MKCLDCHKTLVGRSDKKFCSNSCRSNFHNRRNSSVRNQVLGINNILKNNLVILNKLRKARRRRVKHEELEAMGFNFKYNTHSYTEDETIIQFCYQYGLERLDESRYRLVTEKYF